MSETSLGDCFDLIDDLSTYPSSLEKDEVSKRTAALKEHLRKHIELVKNDHASSFSSQNGLHEEDAEEDSPDDVKPSTPDEVMSSFKHLIEVDAYQDAYDLFDSYLDEMPQLVDRMDEAIEAIADDIVFPFVVKRPLDQRDAVRCREA